MKRCYPIFLFVFIILFFGACADRFDVEAAVERIHFIYLNETDAGKLRDEMGYLLTEIEKREDKIRKRYELFSYDYFMVLFWLRLSSVYEYLGENTKQQYAFQKAVSYHRQSKLPKKVPDEELAESLRNGIRLEHQVNHFPWKKGQTDGSAE